MTTKILISGCSPKVLKIALSYLLQNEAGFSLSTADRAVNGIIKDQPLEFEIDDEKAASFVAEAKELGATASILPPA